MDCVCSCASTLSFANGYLGLTHSGDLSKSDEESKECVICMTNERNTCVLPCRHICCCAECANTLRLQTDRCPVCREPITELVYLTVNPDYLSARTGADGTQNIEMNPL